MIQGSGFRVQGSGLRVERDQLDHARLEAGSYLRRIDSCITQLESQGPFWTYHESKEEEEEWLMDRMI